MSEQLSETVAYQGMKISQLADRVSQLEQIVMKFSSTANANQQKLIQEIMTLKAQLSNAGTPEPEIVVSGEVETQAAAPM